MDRNNIIGLTLIFMMLFAWMRISAPSQEELAAEQRLKDSIAQVNITKTDEAPASFQTQVPPPSTLDASQLEGRYGIFATAASGDERIETLENEFVKVSFTNKGGRIKEVELKKHFKILTDSEGNETKVPVKLLEDDKNKFEYILPIANAPQGALSTSDLYFTPQVQGRSISFKALTSNGGFFEQVYTIDDNYGIDYDINMSGLNQHFSRDAKAIKLNWVNYLDRIEKNTYFEKYYTTIYYKEMDEDPDYCSCRADDETSTDEKVQWISNSNQFFNSSLVADAGFAGAAIEVKMEADDSPDLKKITSEIQIPFVQSPTESIAMKMYVGPNEYNRLKAFAPDMQNIIPYGWSIFGTINRYVIRPLFEFLLGFIGSKGIVILLLTFLVKLALYPLTYKMLHSQQKMAALKPQLAKTKEKYPDDAQKQQMETMKLYQEFGVNPLGGCLPMVAQMPIWYALFRFFPASIDFRQASFLWANDLSSYDAFFHLPFELPMNMGSHISLFTLLWAFTTLIYTYYNTRHMDMSANPAMKYMQYLMPVMFLGFFNTYASGLTCYMLFSNMFNISQTLITKNVIIDHEKIERELQEYKKKPKKKKSGFRARLEDALKEQQRLQQEQQNKKKS